ncbi:hypothetical protein [Sutcliffiella rhizosphaerae]|uniref:Uncharacterized protein n=1 Tax=Sutcliffiella rhizosphaerae TaxID=2880967 RepID=A0ABN8ADZ2_9BACI|nr:hypothetical protein [Sutcliffiella rhizosphaerae]CAG9622307.1 hypothetical protein BACCIP111883_03098 [Sutcliffiella rhizosphaerae]
MRKFITYFFWTLFIGSVFYFGLMYQDHLINEARMNFNMLPAVIYATLFPILLGILLRLPKLLKEIKEQKEWSVNWIKLLTIGLPTLYIAIVPPLSFSTSSFYLPFTMQIVHLDVTTVVGLIFGYVLLDSLKKE